jgi:hypothetical protein
MDHLAAITNAAVSGLIVVGCLVMVLNHWAKIWGM